MSVAHASRPPAAQGGTRESRPLSPTTLAFLTGVPLAWAVLLLFHPGGDGTQVYLDLRDDVTIWMVVHLGMLIFIPLMAVVVFLLLRGVEGTAARVSRIALLPYVVFYGAFETLQGLGNGVLVNEVNGALPEAERADVVQGFAEHPLVRDFGVFSIPGTLGLTVALVAAGVALRGRAGAPLSVALLLGLAGFLIPAHPPPFGPVGLALFIAAVVLLARSRASAAQEVPRR